MAAVCKNEGAWATQPLDNILIPNPVMRIGNVAMAELSHEPLGWEKGIACCEPTEELPLASQRNPTHATACGARMRSDLVRAACARLRVRAPARVRACVRAFMHPRVRASMRRSLSLSLSLSLPLLENRVYTSVAH